MKKRLYRSTTDRKVMGVCAGIADYFSVDPTIVRIVFAILTLFTTFFPGFILYFLLAFIIPEDNGYIDTDSKEADSTDDDFSDVDGE